MRKTPYRHRVKTHIRLGRKISSFWRGHGIPRKPPLRQRTLIQYQNPYRIITLPKSQMYGYQGMNYYTAKELGIPFPYPKNTILIVVGLSPEEQTQTIKHEKIEIALMKKGMKYAKAHQKAENLDRGNINTILDERLKILKQYDRYRKNWWFKVEYLFSSQPIIWTPTEETRGFLTLDEAVRKKEEFEKKGLQARVVLHERIRK